MKKIDAADLSLRVELMMIEPPEKTKSNEKEFAKLPDFIGPQGRQAEGLRHRDQAGVVSCSEPRCPARGKATLLKLFRGPGYAYEVRSHGARDPFTAPHDALPFVRRRGRAAHLLPARLAELSDTDNGFSGPDAWYVTADANIAYARRAPNGGALVMPVLFFHALHDYVCETVDSRLAEPMRESCADLTEIVLPTGHWMEQERPELVNAGLARWLGCKFPDHWHHLTNPLAKQPLKF